MSNLTAQEVSFLKSLNVLLDDPTEEEAATLYTLGAIAAQVNPKVDAATTILIIADGFIKLIGASDEEAAIGRAETSRALLDLGVTAEEIGLAALNMGHFLTNL